MCFHPLYAVENRDVILYKADSTVNLAFFNIPGFPLTINPGSRTYVGLYTRKSQCTKLTPFFQRIPVHGRNSPL
jgi:hypothetical protein